MSNAIPIERRTDRKGRSLFVVAGVATYNESDATALATGAFDISCPIMQNLVTSNTPFPKMPLVTMTGRGTATKFDWQ